MPKKRRRSNPNNILKNAALVEANKEFYACAPADLPLTTEDLTLYLIAKGTISVIEGPALGAPEKRVVAFESDSGKTVRVEVDLALIIQV